MPFTFRPGTIEDSFTAYRIFFAALAHLWQKTGAVVGNDNTPIEAWWQKRQSLFEHLSRTAEHFWLAEMDGEAVGYARSVLRGTTRQLTELFVLPDKQAGGVGRELLKRAFPAEGANYRTIIATLDSGAQSLYLRSGVVPLFPGCYFELPETVEPARVDSDLEFQPVDAASPETLAILRQIDAAIIGQARDIDHAWLMNDRRGFIYYRGQKPVGYGYSGKRSGPFALLKAADYPVVLSHAVRIARETGADIGLEVPLINRAAVRYLLANGYRMDTSYEFFMSNRPFGKFENYIFTSPPLFI